jgi:hypothetical protein
MRCDVKRIAMRTNRSAPPSDPLEGAGQRLSFVLPADMDLQLRSFARESERSLGAVVRLALRRLLAETGGPAGSPVEEREVA